MYNIIFVNWKYESKYKLTTSRGKYSDNYTTENTSAQLILTQKFIV